MTHAMEQVAKELKQAVLDGALTDEAMAYFNDVVRERDELRAAKEHLEEEGKIAESLAKNLREQRDKLTKDLAECKARESGLEAREKAITKLELQAEFHQMRVADHKEMFSLVFRNTTLRKKVLVPVEGKQASQYDGGMAGYAHEGEETEVKE